MAMFSLHLPRLVVCKCNHHMAHLMAQDFFLRSAFRAEMALTDPNRTLAVTCMGGTKPLVLLLLLLLFDCPNLDPGGADPKLWWHDEQVDDEEEVESLEPHDHAVHLPLLLLLLF